MLNFFVQKWKMVNNAVWGSTLGSTLYAAKTLPKIRLFCWLEADVFQSAASPASFHSSEAAKAPQRSGAAAGEPHLILIQLIELCFLLIMWEVKSGWCLPVSIWQIPIMHFHVNTIIYVVFTITAECYYYIHFFFPHWGILMHSNVLCVIQK